jgi:hypothetical protein
MARSIPIIRFGLLMIGILNSFGCFSQSVTPITDSTGLTAYLIQRGETGVLQYDSAYVLNKRLYKLYNETYNKASKGNLLWQEFARAYTKVIVLQDSALKSKDFYYNQLKQSFDTLAGRTGSFLSRTDDGLKEIDQRLANATGNVENIKTSINSALETLKLQRRQKFHLVLGGVAIGASLASILFLATR